ncbi:ArsR/SmtB family transcription factor [Alicyclobacillus kakegawensis]|uniref:ArsR/SmtB family transcription factor n=1 Tax=Alicyclobacillus kakegawensis TaxID=392012 RepID=UPI001FE119E9|nr:helix-turn-helix domain-containing protein [Alicyclobacillus kakegawensis]
MTRSLDDFLVVAKALSSDLRVSLLKELLKGPKNITEISAIFGIPPSTVAINVKKLEDAGLIRTELVPGTRGTQKVCAAVLGRIVVDIYSPPKEQGNHALVEMPVGHFFEACVTPTCGMLSSRSIIGEIDDPASFFEPERTEAGLIWFRKGYLEYRFPKRVPNGAAITNLELSMEICSEAPLHNPNWPSDITLSINGIEVGTWTSPGDFGGERGLLTPSWWGTGNTQFGLLKTWRVTQHGAFIDGRQISDVDIESLRLDDHPYVAVRLEVKEDALNDGGLNLFGRGFGNYDTDITMRLDYDR